MTTLLISFVVVQLSSGVCALTYVAAYAGGRSGAGRPGTDTPPGEGTMLPRSDSHPRAIAVLAVLEKKSLRLTSKLEDNGAAGVRGLSPEQDRHV